MSTSEHYLIKIFSHLKETDALSQSYLFFGESSSARRDFCLSLLRYLETGSWTGKEILFDSMEIPKIDGVLGIDAVRSATRFLWQTPAKSAHRAIFMDGEAMTIEAQNALLKIAEEPPRHGMILIGASDPLALAAPLSSRLQKFYVSPLIIGASAEDGRFIKEAKKFISSVQSRKDIIKAVVANEEGLAVKDFVRALLVECRVDPIKNIQMMKMILDRFVKISELNTNKKLQLETLISL